MGYQKHKNSIGDILTRQRFGHNETSVFIPCERWTTWPTSCRRHFQLHFSKWKSLYVNFHFTEVRYQRSNENDATKFPSEIIYQTNKANLRDLIAATGLVILLKFDPNRFFSPCDLEIWCMTSKNNRAPLLYYMKLCVSFQIHRWIQTEVTLRKRPIRVEIGDFLSLLTIEIWWMTLENNRAPLLHYIKLCASFQIHRWIETEATVRKRSIRVKIGDFLSCVTLKYDGWPWKTIGHLFDTTPSFVHHFKSICEFKLELQSGNTQFGSKLAIFCPVWPWNLTDDLEKQ